MDYDTLKRAEAYSLPRCLTGNMIGTRGFVMVLKEYLVSGAGLEELCGIVHMEDRDGNPKYEEFINEVMDSKLHIKEKTRRIT